MSKSLSEQFEQTDADINRHAERFLKTFKAEVLKGYQGATHSVNLCAAEYAECAEKLVKLQERVEVLEEGREADAAEIGRLQEAYQKAREAFANLDCTKCKRSET